MDQARLNHHRIGRSFANAAHSYDAHAVLQREIGTRLLDHLNFIKLQPKRILDIGCGTGFLTRALQKRYPKADVYGLDLAEGMLKQAKSHTYIRLPWKGKRQWLAADAQQLPFANAGFDLVCSSLAMQWVNEPAIMMQEMRRVLAVDGLILFATFGRQTLFELRQTLASISPDHTGLVLPFPDVTSLGDALSRLALHDVVCDTDVLRLSYPDTMSLVRELKGLGASAAAIPHRPKGLYGRKLLRELDQSYRQQHQQADGQVIASFEALYAQAWYQAEDRHADISIQAL